MSSIFHLYQRCKGFKQYLARRPATIDFFCVFPIFNWDIRKDENFFSLEKTLLFYHTLSNFQPGVVSFFAWNTWNIELTRHTIWDYLYKTLAKSSDFEKKPEEFSENCSIYFSKKHQN